MSSLVKAIKITHDATARGSRRQHHWVMHDVLHLEIVMQRVLAALPLEDLQTFLSACGGERELAWLWTDAKLWEDLLTQHFGGRRSVAIEAQGDDEEDGDDGFDGDDDDEEEDEEEDDEEHSDDEDEAREQDEEEDEEEEQHEAAPEPGSSDLSAREANIIETDESEESTTVSNAAPVTTAQVDLPVWLNVESACAAAREFVVSLSEWTQFQERISVVRGDIGTIQDIGGHAIDAIGFPGNTMMHNPYNAAAGAVFRRAGEELDRHTRALSTTLRAGQSYVTPGFDSGARVLIHCSGPYNSHPRLFATLAKTYRNVLRKAKLENVACLAMTSISTGNFGVPIPEAAQTAMRAIQGFLRAHHDWQSRIGIVCYEENVLAAFQLERQRVLDGFNAAPTQ